MKILAIDSGKDTGWALFENAELIACGLDRETNPTPNYPTRAVIERPHAGKSKASKDDIIVLAIRAGEQGGRVLARYGIEPEYIIPTVWKGSIDKDVAARRIWEKLNQKEQVVVTQAGKVVAKSKHHNIIDAVGIGLHVVGRGIVNR